MKRTHKTKINAARETSTATQELLTVNEAASLLRLTRATIYKLVKTGDLPSRKFGASIRVFRHKLLELAGTSA